jgi:hypothetical protein
MFKSLKLLVASTVLLGSQVAIAEKITVVTPFPPGGTITQIMDVLSAVAQKQGNQIEVRHQKSCAESIEFMKNKSNVFLNITSDIYEPGEPNAACLLDPGKDDFRVWGSLIKAPFYICAAPGKQLTINDPPSQPRTIGYVSGTPTGYLTHMLSNFKGTTQFKLIPYRGGGEVNKAAQAGDIDTWFGSGQIRVFPTATCVGSGIRNDPRKLPFFGELTKPGTNLPEYMLVNLLISNPKTISKEAANVMTLAINSTEFKEYVEKNKSSPGTLDGQALHLELVNNAQAVKKLQKSN